MRLKCLRIEMLRSVWTGVMKQHGIWNIIIQIYRTYSRLLLICLYHGIKI